ncbi:hypothetical protein SH467x_004249 [Pirellulaceae bacterium SH467]
MRQRLSIFIVTTAAMATFANPVFAHPGHDAHVPQEGLLHWVLSPSHATAIGFMVVAAFLVFAAVRRSDWIAKKAHDTTAGA